MREFGRTDVSVRRCGRGFLPQGERGHGPRDRDRGDREVVAFTAMQIPTIATASITRVGRYRLTPRASASSSVLGRRSCPWSVNVTKIPPRTAIYARVWRLRAAEEGVARPVLLRVSIEAETPARHQENSAGSVVWALPNFLGVWCIEPPREREREGEDLPRVVGGDMAASCAAVGGGGAP